MGCYFGASLLCCREVVWDLGSTLALSWDWCFDAPHSMRWEGRLQIGASCYPGDCDGQSNAKQPLEEGRKGMNMRFQSKWLYQVVGVDGWSNGRYRDGASLSSYSVITSSAASYLIIPCRPPHYQSWTNITMALQLINKHFEQTLLPPMMTLQTFARQWWHCCCHRERISLTNTQATRPLVGPNY